LLHELFGARGARMVRAYVDPDNVASVRLLAAVGMCRLPENQTPGVPPRDLVFELDADAWRASVS
jgi:RimJ/RimL family protein N-acetyltransferase